MKIIRTRRTSARLARLPLNRIVISGFGIIFGMVLLLGAVSYHSIYRMHALHERNQQSYTTMTALKTVQDQMTEADSGIRSYFSGNGWRSHSGDKAAAVFELADGRLAADVVLPGVTAWDVQFFQGPFPLERGVKYMITFDARSDLPRTIQVVAENSVNYNRHLVKAVQVEPEWQAHSLEFVMLQETDVLMQLSFQLGKLSAMTPETKHRLEFDRISLVEADSGKQLIKNGDFMKPDVDANLAEAAASIRDALTTAAELTEDHIGQQQLLHTLSGHMETWRRNNEVLIRSLLAQLRLSGSLGVGLELQSREGNLVLAAEIEETIKRVESVERQKLAEREAQAEQYRMAVYGTLGAALLLVVLTFIGLYRYVNRSIVRPIERTTAMLRDMAVDETKDGAYSPERLEREMDASSAEVHTLHRHIADYVRLLHNQMRIDGLTGLYNRVGFDRRIEELLDKREPAALILIDVDHFKQVNDTWGHLTGDDVLRALAAIMTEQSGPGGYCFRYGGEEFGVLLPGRDEAYAYEIAERIRESFAAAELPSGLAVTLSAGLTVSLPGDTPASVIERADGALYLSKAGGRNRTTASA